MELNKEKWNKSDGVEFLEYLNSLSKGEEKSAWEKNILQTNMKCIAVPSKQVQEIITKISKGNFISFIDLWLVDNFTSMSITGKLITKIKDWDTFESYLDKYVDIADNWASIDALKFNIKNKQEKFWKLLLKYLNSPKPFVRRMGFSIMFNFINDEYIDKIFECVNKFTKETHYYVNMMIAWLVCECFVKNREKTLMFLNSHKLNKFVINKAISKCRDSFRVSDADKEMLLKFRVKE